MSIPLQNAAFQDGAMVNTVAFGSRPENVEVPHNDTRAPTPQDVRYPIGKRWIDKLAFNEYVLMNFVTTIGITTAVWEFLGGATTVVTAAASPQTANGRIGSVTFSGVSIAAAATESFVINNASIAGATTPIQVSMVGATSGAALTIQSITNAVGSTTIVVTNGTGATTTTANITFTYQVLN